MGDESDELSELLTQLRVARAELPALLAQICGYTEKDNNVNAFYEIARSVGKWRSEVCKLAEAYDKQKVSLEAASKELQQPPPATRAGEIDLTAPDPDPGSSLADYGGDFDVGAEFLDLTGEG